MKDNKTTDLNMEALQTKLIDLKRASMGYRFQLASGQLPKTHVIRQNRREIARVKTQISKLKK